MKGAGIIPTNEELLAEIEQLKQRLKRAESAVEPICHDDRNIAQNLPHSNDIQTSADSSYRQLIEHAPAAIAMFDQNLLFLCVSKRWLTDFRLEGKPVIGQSQYEVFPDIPERWRQAHIRGLNGEIIRVEEDCFERANGENTWHRWELRPWYTSHGSIGGIVIFTEDITARKKMELSLHQSEERFRTSFEQTTVGFIQADLRSGRFTLVNSACSAITGYSKDELLGMNWKEITHPDDLESNLSLQRRALTNDNKSYRMEKRYLHKNGSIIWVDLNVSLIPDATGKPEYAVALIVEITDRKRAEEALRLLNRKLSRLIDSNIIGIIFADNERITDANDAFLLMVGYTRADMAEGRLKWRAMTPPEFDVDDRAMEELRQRGVCTPFQKEYLCKDGRRVPVMIGAATIDSTPATFIGFVQDMSRIKEIEKSLQEANRRKNNFLAILAHELRNPLAPLVNGLQLIRMAGEDTALVEQSRAMMERQVGQLVRLVDDLIDLSRINRGTLELRKERIDLSTVLTSAIETSRPQIEAMDHRVEITQPAEAVFVQADPIRLAQLFSNLLNNAAKYSERCGHIWITTERRDNEVLVSIRDMGIGIAADQLPSIFEMFSQVERSLEKSQGGLGIGLALVKQLIELHGGRIEAHSEGPGKGSEFIVHLPVDLKAPTTQTKVSYDAPTGSLRILVVDDNKDVANSLSMVLKLMGNTTETANDGEKAISLVTKFLPDVILLDLGMPGMNGYDVCRRIRAMPGSDKIVIIAQTGWGQAEDRQRTQEAGFEYHLVKPVAPAALAKLLDGLQSART